VHRLGPNLCLGAADACSTDRSQEYSDHHQPTSFNNVPPINDWFAASGLGPARLDMCTSVALVSHLVSEGAAIGLLPHKMIETQIANGAISALAAVPRVEDGSVYAVSWAGEQTNASVAVIKSVRKVLSSIDYLHVAQTP
jgi:DNA-binding transcriptional LysR family regulator